MVLARRTSETSFHGWMCACRWGTITFENLEFKGIGWLFRQLKIRPLSHLIGAVRNGNSVTSHQKGQSGWVPTVTKFRLLSSPINCGLRMIASMNSSWLILMHIHVLFRYLNKDVIFDLICAMGSQCFGELVLLFCIEILIFKFGLWQTRCLTYQLRFGLITCRSLWDRIKWSIRETMASGIATTHGF